MRIVKSIMLKCYTLKWPALLSKSFKLCFDMIKFGVFLRNFADYKVVFLLKCTNNLTVFCKLRDF